MGQPTPRLSRRLAHSRLLQLPTPLDNQHNPLLAALGIIMLRNLEVFSAQIPIRILATAFLAIMPNQARRLTHSERTTTKRIVTAYLLQNQSRLVRLLFLARALRITQLADSSAVASGAIAIKHSNSRLPEAYLDPAINSSRKQVYSATQRQVIPVIFSGLETTIIPHSTILGRTTPRTLEQAFSQIHPALSTITACLERPSKMPYRLLNP